MNIVKKSMIFACLLTIIVLKWSGDASAVPHLQLYTPGGAYDSGTETWVSTFTPSSPFELQVISAKEDHTDVRVSLALTGIANGDTAALSAVNIDFGGLKTFTGSDFSWGKPYNLSDHSVFDAYWAELSVGNFGDVGPDVVDYYPGPGGGGTESYGEVKTFDITITGVDVVHFDAYTREWNDKKSKWEIDEKAPFSHDAEAPVPEPATIALLGMGFASMLGYSRKRKSLLKKS